MAVTIQKYETADNQMLEKCGHGYKIITGYLSFATYITDGVPMDMSLDFPTRIDLVLADAMSGYRLPGSFSHQEIRSSSEIWSKGLSRFSKPSLNILTRR